MSHSCNIQVVSSICELVEGSFSNIKSGWRPLFGALRAVRMQPRQHGDANESPDRAEHPLAPVCNVFEAFLNTDNVTVFANAAIDCILCLLKFVRGGSKYFIMRKVIRQMTKDHNMPSFNRAQACKIVAV